MNATKEMPAGPPAFDAVFIDHGPFVWRLLARLGAPPRDLPDLCQEVFVVIHRRLSDFDEQRGSLRTWIYGICARAASDYRRRHPSHRETSAELLPELHATGQPDAELETRRAWLRLALVLDELDDAKRQVFVLYELEGLSMAEISSALQCPLQTAYARLYSARRLVLAAFQAKEGA